MLTPPICSLSYKNGCVSIIGHKTIQFTNINLTEFCKEKDFEVCAIKLHIMSCITCIKTIYKSPCGYCSYFLKNLESILKLI